MSDVKKLNPEEYVRSHVARYWGGNPNPSVDDVSRVIVDQLGYDGCKRVGADLFANWIIVYCELAWVGFINTQYGGIGRIFEDVVGLPSSGPNDLRAEWFVKILVSRLHVYVGGKFVVAKGARDLGLDEYVLAKHRDQVCICYQL